ncbi:MAG: hypothetical protein COY11_02545, partial [Candidatus Portnoybacteria bacterium CG_4_10_14_0_2_um_filter_44_20]
MIDKSTSTKYISLTEASELCSHSQEYLSLRARQGKLRAVKLGRNWVTTKEWLSEYLESVATEQADEVMIAGSAARKSGPRPTGKKYLTEKHWVSRFVFFSATLNLLARQGFSVGGFQYFVRSRNKFGMILKAIYGHCSRGLEKFFSFRIKRFDCRLADLARITMVVVSIGALVCLVAGPSVGLIRNEARETKGLGVGVWNGIQRLVVENAVSLGEFSAEDDFLRPVSVSAKNLIGAGSEVLAGAINWGGSLPDEMLSGLESQRLSLARNFKAASHNFVFVSGTGLEVIADAYGQAPGNLNDEWLATTRNLGAATTLSVSLAKDRLVFGAEKFNFALSDLRQRAQGLTVDDGVAATERLMVRGEVAGISLILDLKQAPSEIHLSARHFQAAMAQAVGSGLNFLLNCRTGARVILAAYENAPENILSGWELIEEKNQLIKESLGEFASVAVDNLSGLGHRTAVFVREEAAKGARLVISEAGKAASEKTKKFAGVFSRGYDHLVDFWYDLMMNRGEYVFLPSGQPAEPQQVTQVINPITEITKKIITEVKQTEKLTYRTYETISSLDLESLRKADENILSRLTQLNQDLTALSGRFTSGISTSSNAPLNVGSTGFSVSGHTILASLGVSGDLGVGGSLGVSKSLTIGSLDRGDDDLISYGSAYFYEPVTISNSLTQTGSGRVSFAGPFSSAGRISAGSGLDVTGNLTVSATTTLASSLAVDTNTLYVDADNNRVGIGTTSPLYTLDVNGSLRVLGDTILGDATSSDIIYINSRLSGNLVPISDNVSDIGSGDDWLRWRTGYFGTSVGIGGTATSTGTELVAAGGYTINPASDLIASSTLGNIIFATNGSERMRMTPDGYFGIGTTTPYSKLSVWGSGAST